MTYSRTLKSCSQFLNFRRNTANDLPSSTSPYASTAAKCAAAALVFASAGFGAVYAWQTGSHHGPLLGCLSVVMAVSLEVAKPLAMLGSLKAFANWTIVRGFALALLALVAVIYSLTAELSLIAMTRGDVVAERAAALKASGNADADAQRARERYDAAQRELAGLAPSRPAGELEAEISGTLARLGHDCSKIEDRLSGKVCKTVSGLKAELGRAQRRAELEAVQLPVSAPVGGAVVKSADPGAEALSAYLALIGIGVSASLLSELLVLVPVIALEAGSALAAVLVAAYAPEYRTPAKPVESAPEVSAKPRKRKERTPDDRDGPPPTGHRALGRNVVDMLRARGGSYDGGQRGLAQLLDISKSRLNELLAELAAAGQIVLETTRTGSQVRLAA